MHTAAESPPRTPRPRRLPSVLVATGALLSAAVLAAPAAAAPPGVTTAPAPTAGPGATATAPALRPTAAPHCVLAAGEQQTARCFATFPAAVAAATGGRVTDAPASPADAVRDPAFTAAVESPVESAVESPVERVASQAATTASVLVGIEYANLNYGGGSLSMSAPGRCDDSMDVDYRFPTLPSSWNDRISSFRSYSNCAQQLFRDTSFQGGSLTGIVSAMSYVGSTANDRASSVTFN